MVEQHVVEAVVIHLRALGRNMYLHTRTFRQLTALALACSGCLVSLESSRLAETATDLKKLDSDSALELMSSDISSNGAPTVATVAGDDAEAIGAAECDAVEVQVGGDTSEVNVERASRELVGEVVHAIAVDITGAHGAGEVSIIVGGRGDGVHVGRCDGAVIRERPSGGVVCGRGHLCHRDSHKWDHGNQSHGAVYPNLHTAVAHVALLLSSL